MADRDAPAEHRRRPKRPMLTVTDYRAIVYACHVTEFHRQDTVQTRALERIVTRYLAEDADA